MIAHSMIAMPGSNHITSTVQCIGACCIMQATSQVDNLYLVTVPP